MQTERDKTRLEPAIEAAERRNDGQDRRYPVQLRPTFVRLPRPRLAAA